MTSYELIDVSPQEHRQNEILNKLAELIATKVHADPRLKTTRNLERCYESYIRRRWGSWRATAISRKELREWHNVLAEEIGPTTANRALELLRSIYNRAIENEIIPLVNPASHIKKFHLPTRERFLQPEELARFLVALKTLRYETTKHFVLMCLFTGARRSNVASMRWEDIDLVLNSWTIPLTKNGSSQKVPLTTEAIAVLRERLPAKSDWVFPSDRSPSGHLTKPEKAWSMVIERAGLTNLRIHDLRRSLASYQAITGANISVIAATLNHKDLNSTSIYARLNTEPIRQSMETATNAMLLHAGLPTTRMRKRMKNRDLSFVLDESSKTLSEHQAAEMLGVSVSALQQWRFKNQGPPYEKHGFSVFYKLSALQAWRHGREGALK